MFSHTYVHLLVLISYLIAQCTAMDHLKFKTPVSFILSDPYLHTLFPYFILYLFYCFIYFRFSFVFLSVWPHDVASPPFRILFLSIVLSFCNPCFFPASLVLCTISADISACSTRSLVAIYGTRPRGPPAAYRPLSKICYSRYCEYLAARPYNEVFGLCVCDKLLLQ